MKKLAVVDIFNLGKDNYVIPILKNLGPLACYYCSEGTLHQSLSTIKSLAKSGVEIVIDDYENALTQPCFLADIWLAYYWESTQADVKNMWLKMREKHMRGIFFSHSTDHFYTPPGSGMLYSSARQLFAAVGPGIYMKNQEGEPVWGLHSDGGEGVVAGLVHLGENFPPPSKSKMELKTELAEEMGISFATDLPLVVYYVPERLVGAIADKGLEKLARFANVVIKTGGGSIIPMQRVKTSIFIKLTSGGLFYPGLQPMLFFQATTQAL